MTGVKDILIKFIVVPAKDMVLLLHMLLIAAKMLPTNLAIVRRRNSRLHQTPHTWRDNLPRLREQLSQSLLEVNPVALQFALLCFLFKTRLTVSVSNMKAGVRWDLSGLKHGVQDLSSGEWLNGRKFTRGEG